MYRLQTTFIHWMHIQVVRPSKKRSYFSLFVCCFFRQPIWHSIWHSIPHPSVIWFEILSNVPSFYLTFDICSHTCSNMLFGILFDIYYVILSYTLCDKYSVMLSYISCDTYSVILSDLFISHMFWQPIWRFISRKCWHATWHLEFYLTYIRKCYLTSFLPEAWDPCQPQTQTPSLIKHVEKSQNIGPDEHPEIPPVFAWFPANIGS